MSTVAPVVLDSLVLTWAVVAFVLLACMQLMLWTMREPDRVPHGVRCRQPHRPGVRCASCLRSPD